MIYAIFFLVPTIASFYFSFTRWDLFTATWIGLDNYQTFFEEQALVIGLRNTLVYAVLTSGVKVVLGMALALLLTSKIIARGYLRSVIFFPVLVSAVGIGLTFTVLMNPEKGLINQMLGGADIGWLTNPNLALISIALVDIWKGVGLATVIFIAGLVSIPTEYYEAAAVDGASRWDIFRSIILPLARPATATVITLSLIGGLRSFDLIWVMTKGGPGFASDVIASVIYKQYQAGFYGLSTAGSVVLFLVVTIIVVPLTRWLNRGEDVLMATNTSTSTERNRKASTRRTSDASTKPKPAGVIIGMAAIVGTAIFFVVPFLFIFLIASKPVVEANLLEFSWPSNFALFDNLAQAISARDYLMVIAFINSVILTVVSVAMMVIFSAMVAYVWQRRASRLNPVINGLILAGLIVPPAIVPTIWVLQASRSVQDHARTDPDRDRLRASVLHPAVPRLHVDGAPRAG